MLSRSNESTLLKVIVVVIVVAGIAILYLVARSFVSSPAVISSSSGVVDSGTAVGISIAWNGGQAPYTVSLYSSPTSPCTTSSSLVKQVTNQPTASGTFNVSPSATTFYCATVTSIGGSSGVSSAIQIIVNPQLTIPKLVVNPTAIDKGQSAAVMAQIDWTGGTGPYSVALYSGLSASCSADTTPATVSGGTNPRTGVTTTSANFTVSAPQTTSFFCATIGEGSSSSTALTSAPVQFTVNQALAATVSPPSARLDRGQSITLKSSVSHGTPAYTYQWYTGANCESGSQINGQKSPNYAASGLSSSTSFSVLVSDSSPGQPAGTTCAHSTVVVNSPFVGTAVQISPSSTVDVGASVTLSVSWSPAGTSPYSVQLTSSQDSSCSSPVPVPGSNQTGITETTATFNVSPATTTFYCATVADGAGPAEQTTTSVAAAIVVNPAPTPSVSLSPSGVDSGQSTTVTATVTVTGGTAPFTVTLTQGSSSSCSLDAQRVAVSQGSNPANNVAGPTVTFTFASPAATTDYCVTVVDGASTTVQTPTAQEFTVSQTLAASITPPNPSVVTGQTSTLNAVVTQGTGTSPFSYQWYTGLGCSAANTVSGQVTSTFTTSALTANSSFSVKVKDSNVGTPSGPESACAGVSVIVTKALAITSFKVTPNSVDTGQQATVTVSAQWVGGTSTYTATLLSGTSTTCSQDTTVVTVSGGTSNPDATSGLKATFLFPSPTATTYYCLTLKDSATPQAMVTSQPKAFTVNPAMATPGFKLSPSVIDLGQTATVTATTAFSGGTSPYKVSLMSGSSSTCTSDTVLVSVLSGTNPKTSVTGNSLSFSFTSPQSGTYYCVVISDNATLPSVVTSSTFFFTVNPTFILNPLVITSPTNLAVDAGQSTFIVVPTSWSGGTSPYSVTLFGGSSSTCSSDTTVVGVVASNPITGFTGTRTNFTYPSPTVSTYYCVRIVDNSSTPITLTSPTFQFVVNPTLVAAITSVSPTTVDFSQSATLSTTTSFTGGTAPFTCQWLEQSAAGGGFVGLGGPFACVAGALPTRSTGPLSTQGTFNFELSVADSSAVKTLVFSSQLQVSVVLAPVVGLVPLSPNVLDSGQSTTVTATANIAFGIQPYTVSLYSGSSPTCSSDTALVAVSTGTNPQTGVTSAQTTFKFNAPTSSTFYCVKLSDSAFVPMTPSSGTVTFTMNPPLVAGALTVSPSSMNFGQAGTITDGFSWTGGTSPYTVTLFSGNSATCSADTTLVAVNAASNPQTGLTGVTTNFVFNAPNVNTYYCTKITDSSPMAVTLTSATSLFTMNGPMAIASNQATGRIYVAIPSASHILVIDNGTQNVVATVPVGSLPWGIAVNQATNMVYVSNYADNSVTVINGATNTVVTTVAVGTHPTGLAVNSANGRLYVANSGSGSVTVIDMTSNTVITSVPVGTSPIGVAVGPAPTYTVYVTNFGSGTVSVIDLAYGVTVVNVGTNPWGVAVNPGLNRVYVTNSGSNSVTVFSGSTYAVNTTITVGTQPQGITVDMANGRLYVVDFGSNNVIVISMATNSVLGTAISVQNNPWTVAITSGTAFVTNSGKSTISVINLSTNTVTATLIVS